MIRIKITPESKYLHLEIPEEYIDRELEVTITAVDGEEPSNTGTSSDGTDLAQKLIQEELRKEREQGFDRSGPRKIF